MIRLQCLGDQQLADLTEEVTFEAVIGRHQLQQLAQQMAQQLAQCGPAAVCRALEHSETQNLFGVHMYASRRGILACVHALSKLHGRHQSKVVSARTVRTTPALVQLCLI